MSGRRTLRKLLRSSDLPIRVQHVTERGPIPFIYNVQWCALLCSFLHCEHQDFSYQTPINSNMVVPLPPSHAEEAPYLRSIKIFQDDSYHHSSPNDTGAESGTSRNYVCRPEPANNTMCHESAKLSPLCVVRTASAFERSQCSNACALISLFDS